MEQGSAYTHHAVVALVTECNLRGIELFEDQLPLLRRDIPVGQWPHTDMSGSTWLSHLSQAHQSAPQHVRLAVAGAAIHKNQRGAAASLWAGTDSWGLASTPAANTCPISRRENYA